MTSIEQMEATAQALVAPGKGILAADESMPTIAKRFKPLGIDNTEANRRAYRQMLFGAPGIEEAISGVILYDETLRQKADDGSPFPEFLAKRGIIPGIKVDNGAKPLAGCPGETITEGLDGLRERLAEYVSLGARFAKWRAVISIGAGIPTRTCLETNAHALARYAALCQEAGVVPIVEPEVLMDGDHTIERCYEVTVATQKDLFEALYRQRVVLAGTLLKPNMIVSGTKCPQQADVETVATMTLRCLETCVPPAVPGVVFLSGGQSDEAATAHLNAMNQRGPHAWELSYSYGRALQAPALKAWAGKQENFAAGQKAFNHRSRCNSAARYGRWSQALEGEAR
jgi:fructose-bisphosphate aldolase class I